MSMVVAFVQRVARGEADQCARQRIFYAVRDMAYSTDAAHDGVSLSQLERGDCVAKSDLLSQVMRLLGMQTRITRWLYRLPDSPTEVRLLPTRLDIHTAVQVLHDSGDWLLLDATFDAPLSRAGLSVALWDGLTSTAPAFAPLSPMWTKDDAAEIEAALLQIQRAYRGRDKDVSAYRVAFNQWLDGFRSPVES